MKDYSKIKNKVERVEMFYLDAVKAKKELNSLRRGLFEITDAKKEALHLKKIKSLSKKVAEFRAEAKVWQLVFSKNEITKSKFDDLVSKIEHVKFL